MRTLTRNQIQIVFAALPLLLAPALHAQDRTTPVPEASPAPAVDRGQSYYHAAQAGLYEDQLTASGRPEFLTLAVEEYKKAIQADPASSQLKISLARLYLRAGRTGEAESTLLQLLEKESDEVDAHRLLGRIYLNQLGNSQKGVSSTSPEGNLLDKAIQQYQQILKLQSDRADDHMVLGQLYSIQHETERAEAQFKIARMLEPDSDDVILNLVRIYSEAGDLPRAVKTLEEIPPEDRSLQMELALASLYDQLKQYKKAASSYRRAADQAPDEPRIVNALAQALLNDNQLDEALQAFRQVAGLDPSDTEVLIHVGEIQRRQQKYEEALATIRKAREKNPDSLEGGFNEGLLLDILGRFDEAVQVLQKMADLTSHANGAYTSEEKNNRGIFLERLAAVYREQNNFPKAIEAYQQIVDMGGESASRGYLGMAEGYRDAKDFAKALDVARKASAADPANRDLKLMLASSLIESGKTDEGLALAKTLLENKPEDRPVLLAIAQIHIRLRRWHEAEEALNKAETFTTKKEDRPYLVFMRGQWYERQKRFEPAEKFFRQALDLEPGSPMILNYLGYMLADRGERLEDALRLIRKAVEIDPMNGAYLDSLGWAYFKLGQYELAEENLLRALGRDQTDPTIHDHLGDLYEKTGRIRLAAAQWELSLNTYKRSAPADADPADVAKIQRKLDSARIKMAKQESLLTPSKPE